MFQNAYNNTNNFGYSGNPDLVLNNDIGFANRTVSLNSSPIAGENVNSAVSIEGGRYWK